MSEFEDKLNKILSSPADMEKILNVAKSLTGSHGSQAQAEGSSEGAAAAPDLSAITSSLKDIDPKIFKLVTRLVGEYTSGKNDKAALLNAIKPYLKEDRRAKVDKAAEIAKIAMLAKVAFSEFTGGEKSV
jgi:citrate lyase alpha subunit